MPCGCGAFFCSACVADGRAQENDEILAKAIREERSKFQKEIDELKSQLALADELSRLMDAGWGMRSDIEHHRQIQDALIEYLRVRKT